MKISFAGQTLPRSGTLVLFAGEGGKLGNIAQAADDRTNGQIAKAMKAADFEA